MRLVSTTHIAKAFGVTKSTIGTWRHRYPDFPKPAETEPYPRYHLSDIEKWYAKQFPHKLEAKRVRLIRHQAANGKVTTTSSEFPSLERARGYLQAVRTLLFTEWRVIASKDAFTASQGGDIEVWTVDVTSGEPEEWFVVDARLRATGRRQ